MPFLICGSDMSQTSTLRNRCTIDVHGIISELWTKRDRPHILYGLPDSETKSQRADPLGRDCEVNS